jgi:hypothetical protein
MDTLRGGVLGVAYYLSSVMKYNIAHIIHETNRVIVSFHVVKHDAIEDEYANIA